MSDLTLREQMWMYKYWKETDGDERWDKAVALKDEFGVDGVRTFIAAEFDPRVAGDVVFVSEQTKEHPERKAGLKAFFREYSSIISVAEDFYTSVFAALEENYPEVFDKKEFFSRLMRQAKDFLREVIQALLQNPDTRYQDILQQMRVEHRALDPRSCTEAVVAQATIEMINSIGDTETRAVLDEVHTSTDKPHVRQSIDLAYRFTIPSIDDADAIKSLEELYGNRIQFETYALNERMNDMEIKFLADRLSEDDQVCDLGFGTGRLLLPLREQGLKVRGLDYVTRHVDLVRQQVPDAEVFQADWKDTGLQGESQDVVYSLGRNILHEYTLAGQHALFAEVNRILPDGGQFIFDIPDRIRGHYKELVDGYAAVMKERGIENTRYGTIYDSPDGNIFMTRYAYSEMDILQLAEANGFAVESIERSELKTGSGDINMYFTLRKITDNLIDVHETPPLAMAA